MAYVPPSMRKKEVEEKVVLSADSFPQLGNVVPSRPALKTFAEKAKEWEEQRIQKDIKLRVDSRMAQHRLAKAARQAEEDAYITSQFIPPKAEEPKKTMQLPKEDEKPADDWVVVQRKIRKKKEFDYSEPPAVLYTRGDGCWDGDDEGLSTWT